MPQVKWGAVYTFTNKFLAESRRALSFPLSFSPSHFFTSFFTSHTHRKDPCRACIFSMRIFPIFSPIFRFSSFFAPCRPCHTYVFTIFCPSSHFAAFSLAFCAFLPLFAIFSLNFAIFACFLPPSLTFCLLFPSTFHLLPTFFLLRLLFRIFAPLSRICF